MRSIHGATLRTGLKNAAMAVGVRLLPLTQYTPVSKWLAFSLVTVEHLEEQRF